MSKTRVAVIGCGTIANSAHGPSYHKNPNAQLAWCVDIIPERARSLADKYGDGNTQTATDYKDMLKDESVQAVSVCVPNYLHMPITIDCLNAGKHVLCEKPAALNYEEALKMQAAADKNGRLLNIGVVNRFNTAVGKIKSLIEEGALGEVYHVYCSFRAHRSIPGLGGPFTTRAMAGGGVLIDWGVHFLDIINYCTGDPQPVTATAAAYGKLGADMKGYVFTDMWAGPPDYNGTYDVEEFITGMIRTAGPTITLNGAWAQNIAEDEMFIDFIGDKAGVRLQYGKNFTLYGIRNGMLTNTTPRFKSSDMFYDELDAFLKCVNTGEKIRSNIDSALITSRMMDGLYTSAQQGREVVFS